MAEKCEKCCKCSKLFNIIVLVILLANTYFVAGIWSIMAAKCSMSAGSNICPITGKALNYQKGSVR